MSSEASLSNPHDRFFKQTFGRPEVAREFVTRFLPPEVVAHLDVNTLTPVRGSFVDRSLREHSSDLLFRVQRKDGGSAYVYMLFEHKSVPERSTAWQLLRYMTRIWEREWRGGRALAPIVPVVVYHGVRAWDAPTNFVDLVGAPDALTAHVPDFEYHLVDLSRFSDDELARGAFLGIGLMVLKYAMRDDLRDHLVDIFRLFGELVTKETGLEYLETVLRYITAAGPSIEDEVVVEALQRALPGGGEQMASIVDRWIEQGVQQGLQKGLQQGLQEGMRRARRESIVTILRARFGEGPHLDRVACHLDTIDDLDRLGDLIELAARADSLEAFIQALSD